MWLTPPGPYIATTCRKRELTLDYIHTFLTTQGHGEPPRMSDELNAGATSETTRTLNTLHTIRSLNHSKKADMIRMIMMARWYSDNHGSLKLPDICHTGEEKPQKKSHPGNLSRQGIEPGPAACRRACYCLLHNGGHIYLYYQLIILQIKIIFIWSRAY